VEVSKKASKSIEKKKSKKSLKHFVNPLLVRKPISRQQTPEVKSGLNIQRPGVVSMIYHDEFDFLISGYEDSKIRVWGYNEESTNMGVSSSSDKEGISLDIPNETVTSRVAGMSLKATLSDHRDAVVALITIQKDGFHWLVSYF
jgi:hypothetical protein